MNLNDYETKNFSIYQSFAETVRLILEKALLAGGETPLPQSIQCRAKGIDSLRRRLGETGKLDTEILERERHTVGLREDRTALPEYARFAGALRDSGPDYFEPRLVWDLPWHILYKDKLSDGYGGVTMKGIVRRFERVMDKYLIPAGFEIQKAQQEYERVLQGKELFDKNIPSLLDNAQNNNERYEILSGLRDYAILNYDDVLIVAKVLAVN